MNGILHYKMTKQYEQKFRGGSKICIVRACLGEIALMYTLPGTKVRLER